MNDDIISVTTSSTSTIGENGEDIQHVYDKLNNQVACLKESIVKMTKKSVHKNVHDMEYDKDQKLEYYSMVCYSIGNYIDNPTIVNLCFRPSGYVSNVARGIMIGKINGEDVLIICHVEEDINQRIWIDKIESFFLEQCFGLLLCAEVKK